MYSQHTKMTDTLALKQAQLDDWLERGDGVNPASPDHSHTPSLKSESLLFLRKLSLSQQSDSSQQSGGGEERKGSFGPSNCRALRNLQSQFWLSEKRTGAWNPEMQFWKWGQISSLNASYGEGTSNFNGILNVIINLNDCVSHEDLLYSVLACNFTQVKELKLSSPFEFCKRKKYKQVCVCKCSRLHLHNFVMFLALRLSTGGFCFCFFTQQSVFFSICQWSCCVFQIFCRWFGI